MTFNSLSIAVAGTALTTLLFMAYAAPGLALDPMFQSRLEGRINVLKAHERIRRNIIDQLEFGLAVPRQMCVLPTPAPAIDPHRSLFVHDEATFEGADFSLDTTLGQLATQAGLAGSTVTKEEIFQELWDTQNTPPGLGLGQNCTGSINGFPIKCPRDEGQEALATPSSAIDSYKPIALVNRLDLAHAGWRNCGEHRIIYGKQGGRGRNFIIFEAVLPNPKPGCREGCLPVARFWASLSDATQFPTPADRATALHDFYYKGLPGYRPVIHVDHYSATGVTTGYGSSGSGQIRTNQFIEPLWTLKEFKTIIDCGTTPCSFNVVPLSVKVNPFGDLWNDQSGQALGPDFRADLLLNIKQLSADSLAKIGYAVDPEHNAGESVSQNSFAPDNYEDALNQSTQFKSDLSTALQSLANQVPPPSDTTFGLTAEQLTRRALAMSCAGCHQPSGFGLSDIGKARIAGDPSNTAWPGTLGFVHVGENATLLTELQGSSYGPNPGANAGLPISPALLTALLPERKSFLEKQLNDPQCPCRRRFLREPARLARDLRRIQDAHLNAFAPRIKQQMSTINKLPAKPNLSTAPGKPISPAVSKLRALEASRDDGLESKLASAGASVAQPSLRPQTVKLRASRAAMGDKRLEQELRQREVAQIDRSEPARRTVTGSFRVH